MPSSVDFHFQSSLRGAGNNKSPGSAVKLHRGCSGALHGHGVDKVKSKVVPPPCQRDRTCQQYVYDDHMHIVQQQQQNYHHHHNYQQQTSLEDSSDAESPTRRKSMLGLGQVLPAAESKGLPPRSPPKFLTYSTRSLSSSTCSSSSSSRYSGSPSPGIQDQYNSPLQWPFAAANASASLFLEEVSEEGLDDLDEWSADRTSPTCSTLTSSPSTNGSPIDQGRRHGQQQQQPRHSTPSRPYTERNRPSTTTATGDSHAKLAAPVVRRPIISSSNNNSKNGSGTLHKSPSSSTIEKKVTNTAAINNKRIADLKNVQSKTAALTSRSLSRLPSSASSTPRSSFSSQKTDNTTKSSKSATSPVSSATNTAGRVLKRPPSLSISPSSKTTKSTATNQKKPISPKRSSPNKSNHSPAASAPTTPEVDFFFFFSFSVFSSFLLIRLVVLVGWYFVGSLDGRPHLIFPYQVKRVKSF